MFKPVRTILFSTNLLENCLSALEASVSMATQYRATLVLLHVIDREIPGHTGEYFKGLLGEEKWQAINEKHEKDARQALIGKMSGEKVGKSVLRQYCTDAGIDLAKCDFEWKDLVVKDNNIARAITSQSGETNSDIIVMGAKKGFLGRNSMGSKIKEVIRDSEIPVLVVPPGAKKQ